MNQTQHKLREKSKHVSSFMSRTKIFTIDYQYLTYQNRDKTTKMTEIR